MFFSGPVVFPVQDIQLIFPLYLLLLSAWVILAFQ